jgi:hypothetical protein
MLIEPEQDTESKRTPAIIITSVLVPNTRGGPDAKKKVQSTSLFPLTVMMSVSVRIVYHIQVC